MKSGVLRLFPLILAMLAGNSIPGGTKTLGGRTAGYGGYGTYGGKSHGSHKKHPNRLLMRKRIMKKHRRAM
jgi:hypothetical protein